MGLQVVVLTNIRFLSKSDKPHYAYMNVEWLYSADEICLTATEGFYEYAMRMNVINNIAHFYFNQHLESLALLIGWRSVNQIRYHPRKYGIPFVDLMYTNCFDGSFDWLSCSRLAYEFETWYDVALKINNAEFVEWYDQMMSAFKYAAENNGAVLYL